MRAWFWNCLLFAALLACSPAQAEVRLPALISDGMVLQRGEKARIWGWADPGENVEVTIAGRRAVVRADADTVQVWSESVPRPNAVRYAWANNPEGCNLYNGVGLPASPFTTTTYPPNTPKEK